MAEVGQQVLGRPPPPNWAVEWSLPGWLGDALHLPAGPTADLTLANVVGLAYVRLRTTRRWRDPEGDRRTILMLATALYRTWLLAYTDMFASGSPFWPFFEQYMAQWEGATLTMTRQRLSASASMTISICTAWVRAKSPAEDLRGRCLSPGGTGRTVSPEPPKPRLTTS